MTVFEWIEMAKGLDADGLEMYDAFFTSFEPDYLERVGNAIREAGFAMPMLCCSPDFTQPDPDARKRAIEQQANRITIARYFGGPGVVCRILSGQRYPEVSREQGIAWTVEAIQALIPVARMFGVVLGLENHYKDGFWQYPEFAQKQDVFLEILNAIPESPNFGVQYDPSNALVAGDDPVELLSKVAPRVVSMHASDRRMENGVLLHGVTGTGLNDYPAIFRILAGNNYQGWISIEDGVNGMGEMAESLAFLRRMCAEYFPA
jgi:sugar phosphate isomerase/epimerase